MLALQLYVSQLTLTTKVICPQKYLLTSSLASFRAIPILFLQFTNSVNESVHMLFVGIIRRTFQAKLNKIITNNVVKT
jgi:hypothetical protein